MTMDSMIFELYVIQFFVKTRRKTKIFLSDLNSTEDVHV